MIHFLHYFKWPLRLYQQPLGGLRPFEIMRKGYHNIYQTIGYTGNGFENKTPNSNIAP
jgi:hypothetical protein